MAIRKVSLENREYYHVYNRGTDKRDIVSDAQDIGRFLKSLVEFNVTEPIGSIYENSFRKENDLLGTPTSKLVEIVAFNLLDNHYHIILKQLENDGISRFVQRVAGGYTKYFNEKHERTGVLFQGAFKAAHIQSDENLTQLSAYVNLNHVVHKLGSRSSKWGIRSSWEQYAGECFPEQVKVLCSLDVVLGKYSNKNDYKREAQQIIRDIISERLKLKSELLMDHLVENQLGSRSSK